MWRYKGFRNIAGISVVGAGIVVGTQVNGEEDGTPMIQQSFAYSKDSGNDQVVKLPRWDCAEPMPKRADLWKQLQARSKTRQEYDVLVIGGGATGTGCALDAQTRCVALCPCLYEIGPSDVDDLVQGAADIIGRKRGFCCWNVIKIHKVSAWRGSILGKSI